MKKTGLSTFWVFAAAVSALSFLGAGCNGNAEQEKAVAAVVGLMSEDELTKQIAAAQVRVEAADKELTKAKSRFDVAKEALKSKPDDQAAKTELAEATKDIESWTKTLDREKFLRSALLHPKGSLSDGKGIPPWVPYILFGVLGLMVIWFLGTRLYSRSPLGASPQQMITFLIAVTTVGIALIMVLATVVLDSADLKERFALAREVLAVLIGVLGTIVGFYFGKSTQAEGKPLDLDPIVIGPEGDQKIAINTMVRGGRGPYECEVSFVPTSIQSATPTVDESGKINVKGHAIGGVKEFSYVVKVTDEDNRTVTKVGTYQVPKPAALAIESFKVTVKDGVGTLNAKVVGGKPKYQYEATFTPSTVNDSKPIKNSFDDPSKPIQATFTAGTQKEFTCELKVTDGENHTVSKKEQYKETA